MEIAIDSNSIVRAMSTGVSDTLKAFGGFVKSSFRTNTAKESALETAVAELRKENEALRMRVDTLESRSRPLIVKATLVDPDEIRLVHDEAYEEHWKDVTNAEIRERFPRLAHLYPDE